MTAVAEVISGFVIFVFAVNMLFIDWKGDRT